MGKQNEIIISGVGGQGLILCGTLMAQAAVLHDHRQATLSSEYGVETRGTFAKSDVIISDQEIYFPDVTEPDIIVCLAQTAYERDAGKYGPEVLIIYNQDEVAADPAYSASQQGIDITKISRELGNTAVANIVTLGIVAGVLKVVTAEGVLNAIREFFGSRGEKTVALNIRAFETGYEIGRNMDGCHSGPVPLCG